MAEYCGWSNFETWAFKLWMDEDNKEGSWTGLLGLVEDTSDVYELSKFLKEQAEEEFYNMMDEAGVVGWMHDISSSALCRIDFYEIAQAIINDNEKEKEIS